MIRLWKLIAVLLVSLTFLIGGLRIFAQITGSAESALCIRLDSYTNNAGSYVFEAHTGATIKMNAAPGKTTVVGQTFPSRDGSRVAISYLIYDFGTGGYRPGLYAIEPGRLRLQFVTDQMDSYRSNVTLSWSPDNRKFVAGWSDGVKGARALLFDTTTNQLTFLPGIVDYHFAQWTDDSQYFALQTSFTAQEIKIWSMRESRWIKTLSGHLRDTTFSSAWSQHWLSYTQIDARGLDTYILTSLDGQPDITFPTLPRDELYTSTLWSPDGRAMMIIGRDNLYILNVEKRIIDTVPTHGAFGFYDFARPPVWAGNTIIFTRAGDTGDDLLSYDTTTGTLHTLGQGLKEWPSQFRSYVINQNRVAFAWRTPTDLTNSSYQIDISNLDGTNRISTGIVVPDITTLSWSGNTLLVEAQNVVNRPVSGAVSALGSGGSFGQGNTNSILSWINSDSSTLHTIQSPDFASGTFATGVVQDHIIAAVTNPAASRTAYLVDLTTGDLKLLNVNGFTRAAWSPDGSHFAVSDSHEIRLYDAQGQTEWQAQGNFSAYNAMTWIPCY